MQASSGYRIWRVEWEGRGVSSWKRFHQYTTYFYSTFPRDSYDSMMDYFGANTSMESFRGRAKTEKIQ